MQIERGLLLIEQERYEQALEEFHRHLAEHPEDDQAMAYAALCEVNLKRYSQATETARQAVGLNPTNSTTHYVLATIYYQRNNPLEALNAIQAALELEPQEENYLSLAAFIHLSRQEWRRALHYAELGLEVAPREVDCINARAMAQIKMGSRSDAREALIEALADQPENAMTRANLAWLDLEEGQREKALEGFQQALMVDPEQEWARDGLLHAMRAQYPLYGSFLKWSLWLSKHSKTVQQQIVVATSVVTRILRELAERYPGVAPLIGTILLVWKIFAYFSWVARPATSLLLRLNHHGRALLNGEEILESNIVGSMWLVMALGALYNGLFGSLTAYLLTVIFLTAPLLVAGSFGCAPGWPRQVVGAATLALTVSGALGVLLFWLGLPVCLTFLKIYFYGFGPLALVSTLLTGFEPEKTEGL